MELEMGKIKDLLLRMMIFIFRRNDAIVASVLLVCVLYLVFWAIYHFVVL